MPAWFKVVTVKTTGAGSLAGYRTDCMKTYRAHYKSPAGAHPVNGTFEFESENKANSKLNATDARIKMLEMFGNEAVSWEIDSIELAGDAEAAVEYVQPQLDFREPKKVRKHHTFERGKVKG